MEKKKLYSVSLNYLHPIGSTKKKKKAFLFDIGGTTTPISFVKDVLFPYVSKNVSVIFRKSWDSQIKILIENLIIDQKTKLE